jgi:hypothetical protein
MSFAETGRRLDQALGLLRRRQGRKRHCTDRRANPRPTLVGPLLVPPQR